MKDVQETMPVLERFVVVMSDHTSRSQRLNDARNVLSICTEGNNPWHLLSTDHVLFQYTKRVAYKDGHCWGHSLNGEDQGNHKSQMRGSLSMLHLTVSIKGIPDANAKLNEVEKDVENVNALQICGRMRGWVD